MYPSLIYLFIAQNLRYVILTLDLPTVVLVKILKRCVKVLLSIQFVHVHCRGDELVVVN
jgi:hypothetical protein